MRMREDRDWPRKDKEGWMKQSRKRLGEGVMLEGSVYSIQICDARHRSVDPTAGRVEWYHVHVFVLLCACRDAEGLEIGASGEIKAKRKSK